MIGAVQVTFSSSVARQHRLSSPLPEAIRQTNVGDSTERIRACLDFLHCALVVVASVFRRTEIGRRYGGFDRVASRAIHRIYRSVSLRFSRKPREQPIGRFLLAANSFTNAMT